MALRIELDGYKPGIAKFLAQKWDGSSDIDMLIQRNQDGYYLLGLKQWSPEKTWHPVTNLMVDNQQLTGEVSEWLVDSLLSQDNSVRFFIQIRDRQNENYIDGGVANITESVLASSALDNSSSSIDNNQVETESEPELSVEQAINSPQDEPITEQEVKPEPTLPDEPQATESTIKSEISEPIKSKSKLGLIITIVVILLLLVGIGIATWYFLFSRNQQKDTSSVQIDSQCSLNNATGDDLSFIQQCLQTKPDADAIIQLINEAKKTDKCNIAQRLYANQAQQNAKIAMLYAKEYDDKYYQENNCFKADKETAIYWYETSLTHDANNSLVKERLSELQK
ncbi:hypothetical protein A9G13_08750 [Gilliamella sp. wkB178]|uniref:hypothetical protein n=1 Tax=Gilliamella sp. wkB178 TaxID=3120259 RepID=UPI00080DEDEB|nr:hypothetical protein [Gilliamella apicola]OCG07063.1 hypothetical protein A9G13_08750 [Gilliamella apicola]